MKILEPRRNITVAGHRYHGNWTLLKATFSDLRDLETIHWQASKPIPRAVLRAFGVGSPSAALYYTIHFDEWERGRYGHGTYTYPYYHQGNACGTRALIGRSVINSTILYSLTAHVIYRTKTPNQDDMSLIWEILASSLNIPELSLSITRVGHGVGLSQPFSFDFKSNPRVRLPSLEVLKLDGYDFGATDNDEWVDLGGLGKTNLKSARLVFENLSPYLDGYQEKVLKGLLNS